LHPSPRNRRGVFDNGKLWGIFRDFRFWRNKSPKGYRLKTYDKKLGDIPLAFGVDVFCKNFPYDLPDAIEERNGLKAFARRVREKVSKGGFDKPESHVQKQ
jgi:hypothetical protein